LFEGFGEETVKKVVAAGKSVVQCMEDEDEGEGEA